MLAFWILVCRFVAVVVKPLVQAPTSELGCYASAANLSGPLFLYPNFNICSFLSPLYLGLRIEITTNDVSRTMLPSDAGHPQHGSHDLMLKFVDEGRKEQEIYSISYFTRKVNHKA